LLFEAGHPGLKDRLRGVDNELIANRNCLLGVDIDVCADRFAALRDDHAFLDGCCRLDRLLVDVLAVVTTNGRGAAGLQYLMDGVVVGRTGRTGEGQGIASVGITHWWLFRG